MSAVEIMEEMTFEAGGVVRQVLAQKKKKVLSLTMFLGE
jgi:hypothetical protein